MMLSKFSLLAAAVVCCIVSFTFPTTEARKDKASTPHPHKGVIKAYNPGPFAIQLTKADEAKLAAGQPVMKQTLPGKDETGGGAICVQDVNAPKEAVWNQILSLDSYKGKVPKVVVCQNYHDAKEGTAYRIKTKMVIGVLPGYSYESYYDHSYHPKENSMTWKLDYDRTSDFDDVSGHWHVEDHPTKGPSATRVFYACDIKLAAGVPGPILNYISNAALKQATGWVKKESEQRPSEGIPVKYGGTGKAALTTLASATAKSSRGGAAAAKAPLMVQQLASQLLSSPKRFFGKRLFGRL